MDCSFRVEILLLIFIIFLIMSGHVLCSCSTVSMMEGFAMLDNIKNVLTKKRGHVSDMTDHSIASNAAPVKEGFVASRPYNILPGSQYPLNDGQSAKYNIKYEKPIDTTSWYTPDLSSCNGKDNGKGIQQIENRKEQQIPLPEGEMLMFANTEFKPECCPNSYSSSQGCACMTTGQYSYLINRGGNNVPYSVY